MATKAQLEANRRHLATLDHMTTRLPEGAKDKIKANATKKGMSLNAYIVSLIEADMGKLE